VIGVEVDVAPADHGDDVTALESTAQNNVVFDGADDGLTITEGGEDRPRWCRRDRPDLEAGPLTV